MTTELTQHELEPEPKRGRQLKHIYPLFTTVRLSKNTMDRLKKYGKYGSSIDDCVTRVLDKLERGYEVPADNRSW